MKIETTLEQMREQCAKTDYDSYFGDWGEVFKYAEGFTIDDVAEVLGSVDGEGDHGDWTAVLKLKDGRFGYVTAGCDYTGWG